MVSAQSAAPGPGLLPLADQYATEVERAAALANQNTFERLDGQGDQTLPKYANCNPDARYDGDPNPSYEPGFAGYVNCTTSDFDVYLTTRELVHTANEIQGAGNQVASLGQDVDGVSRTLRWTAAEEMAAQGSMVNQFNNNQLASLGSRMSALRMGARGFSIAGLPATDWSRAYASNGVIIADEVASREGSRESYGKWGGFLDGSFGWGNRDPSPQEDAFDFENVELSLGIDYRLRHWLTIGGILGYTNSEIDFDESASSILVVDGGVDADGIGFMGFGIFDWGKLYGDISLGYQELDINSDRRIKYPSLNPDLDSVNEQALAEADANMLSASLGFGYNLQSGAFGFDPYISAVYRDYTIDQFEEATSINLQGGETRRFNLVIADQDFESLETRLGMRFSYVFTPGFGTLIPLVDIAWHAEHENDPRVIRAAYGSLSAVSSDEFFNVLTEGRDDSWYTWSVGFSSVVRGGRPTGRNGSISGGLQIWAKYTATEDYEFFNEQFLSAGLRYEF